MDSSSWTMVAALVFLIAGSAFFSSVETAFSTVNQIRLHHMAEEGDKRAKAAISICGQFDRTLSTILIGNNIVNIAASSIATVFFTRYFPQVGALVSTVVMTLLVLTFGEIIPKSWAKANSERLVLSSAGVLHTIIVLFRPLSSVFVALTQRLNRSSSEENGQPSVTAEELKFIIDKIEQEGVLDPSESELVQSALDFDETIVSEILTPRVDLVAIDVDDPIEEVMEVVLRERFSRIPVYEKTIDNIIGVLQTRDLLEKQVRGEEIDLRSILTECLYIPRRLSISELLSQFKRTKIHIAVVTDDYGGTMGIVTTEDIIEELVGEIWDEDDEVVEDLVASPDGSLIVSGDYNITDLLEELDMDPRSVDADYSTVGGWVLDELDHLPKAGEQFTFMDLLVTVLEVEEQRILKVRIRRIEPEQPAEDEETETV